MSNVWRDYMSSKFAQEVLAELDSAKRVKKAQAQFSDGRDRDSLYDVGPGMEPASLGASVETMGVSGGGGSMVGSGDSKALYTMKNVSVPGGQESYADGVVEGLEDKAKAILDVAMRDPTGKPFGDEGNQSLKWDGIAAAGKSVKPFTKQSATLAGNPVSGTGGMPGGGSQMMGDGSMMMGCSMHGEECQEECDLKDLLGDEDEDMAGDEGMDDMSGGMDLESLLTSASTRSRKTVALLKELVKIANELDLEGAVQEANEIDAVIKTEVAALKKKLRK